MELTMDFPQREKTINPTHDIQLFAGRAHKQLAEEIASYLGTSVGPMIIKNFADGEIYVQVQQSIRGDDVFIIQPLSNLMDIHQDSIRIRQMYTHNVYRCM